MYSPVWRPEMYLIWVFLPHDFRVVVFSKLISIFFFLNELISFLIFMHLKLLDC